MYPFVALDEVGIQQRIKHHLGVVRVIRVIGLLGLLELLGLLGL
jgi:hypothetical protein